MLLGIAVLAAEGPTTPATGVFAHGDITRQASYKYTTWWS